MKLKRFPVLLLGLAVAGSLPAIAWQPLYPPMRTCASMILDTANHRAILFGGDSRRSTGMIYNDVWQMKLDSGTSRHWEPLNVVGTPPCPRYQHNAVYDPVGERMILYSGCDGTGILNDVWTLKLTPGSESWAQLNPANPPEARYVVYALFHAARNSLIIFGGTGTSRRYDEVWELKLDSLVWRQVNVSGSKPAAREGGGTMYDAVNDRMVIFGGTDYVRAFNDAWALDLTPGSEDWQELHPTGDIPDERYDFACGEDRVLNRLYVFAGWSYYSGNWYNDTHFLDLAAMTWTEMNVSGQLPFERRNPSGIFDDRSRDFIVFGGDIGSDFGLNETFCLRVGTSGIAEWQGPSQVNEAASLSVRRLAATSYLVRYHLTHPGTIRVKILDASGRLISRLFSGMASERDGELTWAGRDDQGHAASAGDYYCLLETDNSRLTGAKFILTR
jgi:hypothetical protein